MGSFFAVVVVVRKNSILTTNMKNLIFYVEFIKLVVFGVLELKCFTDFFLSGWVGEPF